MKKCKLRIEMYKLTIILVLLASSSIMIIKSQDNIVLQNQRELFIDHYLIDQMKNVQIKIGIPVSAGPAVVFDEPWEGKFSGGYVSVLHHNGKYSMYYRGTGFTSNQITCYAESTDGKKWVKPKLRQYKANGTYDNNIIMLWDALQASHNLSVIYDENPNSLPEEQFKAVGGVASSKKRQLRGLYRYVSPDGIRWTLKDSTALFPNGYGMDSQNVLSWLPSENQYAIYLRTWTEDKPTDDILLKGIRTIARSTSKDFLQWTEPKLMSFGDTPIEDLYTNATQPYFRASHILISMPFRFSSNSRVLSDKEMQEFGIDKSMWNGVSDAALMSSRGGNTYDRVFMESFVRPGLDQANWAARSTIPALGVIPTDSDEISFFLTRRYGTTECYLERMKLRTDGFASLNAGYNEGYVVTKPLIINGASFFVNISTSSIGYVKIILLDEDGFEIDGFGENNSVKLVGDKIDFPVIWKTNKKISELNGRKTCIKFIIKDADVYSFAVFD